MGRFHHHEAVEVCDLEYAPNAGPHKFDECVKHVTCDATIEANSGFYFARNTAATQLLLRAALISCSQRPTVDDQTNLWWAIPLNRAFLCRRVSLTACTYLGS